MLSNLLNKEKSLQNLTYHTGRPPKGDEKAWSVTKLLRLSTEEQGKFTQEAWRELDVMLRKHLRTALRKKGEAQLPARSIKDLAIAASTCNLRAYPESNETGLGAHVPAKLIQVVADRLLKGQVIPIDVTPEPQADPLPVVMDQKPSA